MTRDEQIALLKRDVGEWNKWRASEDPPPIDLAGADLRKLDLSGVRECANLRGANLRGAQLNGANLTGAFLIEAVLTEADLREAVLTEADLREAVLTGAVLIEAVLTEADLRGAVLTGGVLTGGVLTGAVLTGADLRKANLTGAVLREANLRKANLTEAKLFAAKLNHADLRTASLNDADLKAAVLSGADLRDTQFHKARLSNSDLGNVLVNYMTSFQGANVTGCRIERHTLESLENYGGLTRGDRMKMTIVDGVATLRSAYSGFQQWMHLTALVAFLAPYVYFVTVSLIRDHFQLAPGAPQAQLRIALARFIWNGGQQLDGWHLDRLSMTWFLYSLFYNILRAVLLWKTKKLELHEQASGLPAPFSLDGWWKVCYVGATWGFWINLVVVAAHTWHFMGTWVPLPS